MRYNPAPRANLPDPEIHDSAQVRRNTPNKSNKAKHFRTFGVFAYGTAKHNLFGRSLPVANCSLAALGKLSYNLKWLPGSDITV
eukprot:5880394-Amphidinium_carterae.1